MKTYLTTTLTSTLRKVAILTVLALSSLASAASMDEAKKLLDQKQYVQAAQMASSLNTDKGYVLAAQATISSIPGGTENKDLIRSTSLKAGDYARKALELNPKNGDAHLVLASAMGFNLLAGVGISAVADVGEIRDHLEKAAEYLPDNVGARIGLAQWHLNVPFIMGGRNSEALKYSAEAVQIKPDCIACRQVYAESLIKVSNRNKGKAIAQLEAALKIKTNDDNDKKMLEVVKQRLSELR
jgi:tetratricopeptide (TPR) repeat protein